MQLRALHYLKYVKVLCGRTSVRRLPYCYATTEEVSREEQRQLSPCVHPELGLAGSSNPPRDSTSEEVPVIVISARATASLLKRKGLNHLE
ncbi:hypothetical protein INR49_014501 [Caranx melampygus]|nr:hypothetical protein INR49_014501 [Caranx melampygus]